MFSGQNKNTFFVHANSVPAALSTGAFELAVAIVGPKIFNFCVLKGARTYCIINKWHQAAAKECNRKL